MEGFRRKRVWEVSVVMVRFLLWGVHSMRERGVEISWNEIWKENAISGIDLAIKTNSSLKEDEMIASHNL